MMKNLFRGFLFACLAGSGIAAEVPAAIPACLTQAGTGYRASQKVAPGYLRGDFDGDGKPDYAVLVTRGREQGVVVCRGNAAAPVILGAGYAFNDMKDLDFSAWRIHARTRRVSPGFEAGKPPVLTGDALYLEWEAGSAIVYWNGKRFQWYQQGD